MPLRALVTAGGRLGEQGHRVAGHRAAAAGRSPEVTALAAASTALPLDPDSPIHLRPLRHDDGERLRRLFDRLSPETVYRRFFMLMSVVREPQLRRLVDLDGVDRVAVAAVVPTPDGTDEDVVGVARFVRLPHRPDEAEVAVLVEDARQRTGVAMLLLTDLADRARAAGITTLTGVVLASNGPAVSLFHSVFPQVELRLDGMTYEMRIPLG